LIKKNSLHIIVEKLLLQRSSEKESNLAGH
jgi:hypothetical protein